MLIRSASHKVLQDTKGLELLIHNINNKYVALYKNLLDFYINNIPNKLFNYVASYLLKGYVTEKAGFGSNRIIQNKVEINIQSVNKKRAYIISRSLSHSLKILVNEGRIDLSNKNTGAFFIVHFTDQDRISFLVYNLLYACGNSLLFK